MSLDKMTVLVVTCLAIAQPLPADDPCAQEIPSEIDFTAPVGQVIFPHELHTEMGIPCQDCHHETLAGDLSMPHPQYFADFWIHCETCHREVDDPGCPQACSACHHSSPTMIADETLSAKVVIHQSCWECHPTGTGSEASRGCALCHHSDTRSETG
jgi:hypothetical protein